MQPERWRLGLCEQDVSWLSCTWPLISKVCVSHSRALTHVLTQYTDFSPTLPRIAPPALLSHVRRSLSRASLTCKMPILICIVPRLKGSTQLGNLHFYSRWQVRRHIWEVYSILHHSIMKRLSKLRPARWISCSTGHYLGGEEAIRKSALMGIVWIYRSKSTAWRDSWGRWRRRRKGGWMPWGKRRGSSCTVKWYVGFVIFQILLI